MPEGDAYGDSYDGGSYAEEERSLKARCLVRQEGTIDCTEVKAPNVSTLNKVVDRRMIRWTSCRSAVIMARWVSFSDFLWRHIRLWPGHVEAPLFVSYLSDSSPVRNVSNRWGSQT